ncbi:unnamed protein product [Tuber aestivum]|uniref:Uncharacterized protein n=1 Tax=Tuber aestivum TaxID=59557 RepID=A0A292PWX3_9PEZI|nr:unnamed protein product [Tuber aestivum]
MMYLNYEQALIVKIMLGSTHEVANRAFAGTVSDKTFQMGLGYNFVDMGATTILAPGGRKEGDSTFKPLEFRHQKHSWPTLVVECGVSQSLARLVVDSRWWLENSGGAVNIRAERAGYEYPYP